MKLQLKPQTIEAVLWTGSTFSEWPEWIRTALIAKHDQYPKLKVVNDSDLSIINDSHTPEVMVAPGKYLVLTNSGIFTDNFENLSKYYNRLSASGRPVELKQIDAMDSTPMSDAMDIDDNDLPFVGTSKTKSFKKL